MPSDDASTFTFQKALDDRDTLVFEIEYADGDRMTRCPASMFWHDGGLLWVDAGWPTDPGHAFHYFTGTLNGDDPWTLTPNIQSAVQFFVIRDMGQGVDIARSEFLASEDYRARPEGRSYNRSAAFEAALAVLELP